MTLDSTLAVDDDPRVPKRTNIPANPPTPKRQVTDFDRLAWTSYRCSSCRDYCVNQTDTQAARTGQCWCCLVLPSLDEGGARFRSQFGLDPASRSAFHPVDAFGCVTRHAENGPHIVLMIARQLQQLADADHPTADAPGSREGSAGQPAEPPQGPDPEATPLPWGVDPAARPQGPADGPAPTTTKPQRRVSDSDARTDGGQRD